MVKDNERGRRPDHRPSREPQAGDLEVDLDRLVWDPEYREQMRRRLDGRDALARRGRAVGA